MESALFVVGFILIFVLMIVISLVQARKRKEAWQQAAQKMNFQFLEADNSEERFGRFKIFNIGRNRRTYNVLIGRSENDEVRTLDYSYRTGSGKNSHTHTQTLCIIKSKNLSLPHFFIRRENAFFDFLGKLFGGQDINFDEDPTFSKTFVLQGESEQAVRQLFDMRIRNLFMQFGEESMQVEARGDTILFNPGNLIEPVNAPALIMKAINVKKAFCPETAG
ncbi:MAG TPA: hypothetical protein PLU72_17900 [Candidatus Ozemobacteraceae bacterium]|nr:hypothetical protein [Candidatus Ozemobacteraceae bacterium]HQG30072.1 hypothetical protein [Candidatus Ozemobacteraceae bacterium]